MNRDVAKLQGIAQDLSQLGTQLSNATSPPDAETCVSIGQAFIAISEAVDDITAALERAAQVHEQPSLPEQIRTA